MSSGELQCTKLTDECTWEVSTYGYQPSLAANTFFVTVFAVFFFANLALGYWYKTWSYMIAVSLGCLTEVIGYVGRLIMRGNPWLETGFITQICCLIIAPAFNSAAIYLTLKHVVLCFGESASLIKGRMYTRIFIAADLLSLVLQGAGGGIASTANTKNMLDVGDAIMMAGVAWQVAALSVFAVAGTHYIMRRSKTIQSWPLSEEAAATLADPRFRLFVVGVAIAWFTIYVRCIYRIVEMAGGWGNTIMRNEPSFIVLEGVMIVIAVGAQTILHPGWGFPRLSGRVRPGMEHLTKSSRDASMEELRAPGSA